MSTSSPLTPSTSETADRGAAPKPGASAPERYRLNAMLLLGTLLAALVLAVSGHFWHSYQVQRNSQSLLSMADEQAAAEEWSAASETLDRYLRLSPGDREAQLKLAEAYDKAAATGRQKVRAVELYAMALNDSADADARRLHLRRGELLMELGRFDAAQEEVKDLLVADPHDNNALRIRALAGALAARQRGDVGPEHVKAIQDALAAGLERDHHLELAVLLAQLIRDELETPAPDERAKLADAAMDEAVAAFPDHPRSWRVRSVYRDRYGLEGGDADLSQAQKLLDSRTEPPQGEWGDERSLVTRLLAERAFRKGDAAGGRKLLLDLVAVSPSDVEAQSLIARSWLAEGRPAEAIAVLRECLKSAPASTVVPLRLQLAQALIAAGELGALDAEFAATEAALQQVAPSSAAAAAALRLELDFVRVQAHLARRQFGPAAALLRSVLDSQTLPVSVGVESERRASRLMLLGQCYTQLRRWSLAADAFTDASLLAPNDPDVLAAAGAALAQAGRTDEAVDVFRRAVRLPEASHVTWAGLVEVEIRKQLQLPESRRDWSSAAEAVAEAQKSHPESDTIALLAAQLNDARQNGEDAPAQTLAFLERQVAEAPDSLALVGRLATAYEQAGRAAEADAAVARFEGANGSPVGALLLRADLLLQRGQADEADALLAQAMQAVEPERRPAIALARVQAALVAGGVERRALAKRLLSDAVDGGSVDPVVLRLLCDLALSERNMAELATWEGRLAEVEGDQGVFWRYYQALRLLEASQPPEAGAVAAAKRLAAEVRALDPKLTDGILIEARIAEVEGDRERAADCYEQALALGESRPNALQRIVPGLLDANRLVEAQRALERLESTSVELSADVAGSALRLKLAQGRTDEAVELARLADMSEPRSHVMLGLALLQNGEMAEAEVEFRRAVEIGPGELAGWNALFAVQLKARRMEDARATLADLESAAVGDERQADRAGLLAHWHQALGDRDAAQQAFERALALKPNDAALNRAAAMFYAGFDPSRAEQFFRSNVKLQPASARARLDLASFLALSRRDDAALAEAETLLAANEASGATGGEASLRAQILLTRRGPGERARAKELLMELVDQERASGQDRALLADLLAADGELQAAEDQLRSLASRNGATADALAAYAEFLLGQRRFDDAAVWIARLVEQQPDSYRTLSLKCRHAAGLNRQEEARAWIDAALAAANASSADATAEQRARQIIGFAALLTEVGLPAQAEPLYAQAHRDASWGYRPYAYWLAKQGRVREGVAAILAAANDDNRLETAATLAEVLTVGRDPTAASAEMDQRLDDAVARFPSNSALKVSVATWKAVQGDNEKAVALLRTVLKDEPKNALAMNNLAAILAERASDQREALEWTDRAIDLTGRNPQLLDTRGMILMAQGQEDPVALAEAAELFESAVAGPTPDPRHVLHLAAARLARREMAAAAEALRRCETLDLPNSLLTPADRSMLADVKSRLQD